MIPALWKKVEMCVVSNKSWEGWMLTYLTMWVLFQKPAKATHNNPFLADKCTAKQIAELLSKDSNEEYPVSFESFQNVFDENDRVMVCKSYRN
jgi:hypothetical protein